jgi:FkbM family methyltransferase
MINKRTIKKLGLKLHLLHDWAYTFWKVWETRLTLKDPLTSQERKFFLKFWPILKNCSNKSVIAYDIGASIGIASGCLAKIPQIAQVHAFEPIPGSFKRLSERMQPYHHVTCHNVALGDVNQRQKMWVIDKARDASSFLNMGDLNKREFSGNFDSHVEYFPVVRLDDYVREHQLPPPDLVKIDVQGFEDRVLRGGKEAIQQASYCILEMSFRPLYEGSPIFDNIYRQMRKLGFRLIGIEDILKGVSGTHLQIDGVFENERLISLDHMS